MWEESPFQGVIAIENHAVRGLASAAYCEGFPVSYSIFADDALAFLSEAEPVHPNSRFHYHTMQQNIIRLGIAIVSIAFVSSQLTTPTAPEPVVRKHAQQTRLSSHSTACERACASIAESQPHTFFLQDEGHCVLWDAKQSTLIPACRVEPSTPAEVASVIAAVTKERCHFAIRGGGHSRIAGSSNAEDGITIDLKKFTFVEVAKDRKTVRIGGGSVWGDVYRALEAQNLVVIGGRVSDVGVGGLTLGGMSPVLFGHL